jgi:hypothetical protein
MAGEVAPRWAGRDVSSDMMAVEGGVRSVAFLLLVISVDFAEGTVAQCCVVLYGALRPGFVTVSAQKKLPSPLTASSSVRGMGSLAQLAGLFLK